MRTREKAVELIHKQIKSLNTSDRSKRRWHYGCVDLRQLLDFIYDEEPGKKSELIMSDMEQR